MSSTIRLLVFLLILTIPACSTGATGPFFQKLESTEQGMALVYLFAPWNIEPTKAYPIKANGEPVLKLVDGGYYPFRVTPGTVTFEIETTARENIPVTLHAEPGQTYFVRAIRKRHGEELKLLSEEEAIHLITPCRLILERSTLEPT